MRDLSSFGKFLAQLYVANWLSLSIELKIRGIAQIGATSKQQANGRIGAVIELQFMTDAIAVYLSSRAPWLIV